MYNPLFYIITLPSLQPYYNSHPPSHQPHSNHEVLYTATPGTHTHPHRPPIQTSPTHPAKKLSHQPSTNNHMTHNPRSPERFKWNFTRTVRRQFNPPAQNLSPSSTSTTPPNNRQNGEREGRDRRSVCIHSFPNLLPRVVMGLSEMGMEIWMRFGGRYTR